MEYIELDVWKEARILVNCIYNLTKEFPKEEIYGLTSQINRAAISLQSNIAEGCGRNHSKDTLQFLYIARGSLYELKTQLYLAYDQCYIISKSLDKILSKIIQCKKLLNGFINYYKSKI
ncbi:MAG: four helix bundle protein [bacterium]|nr:four helix bundle protein [bacterium]